MLNIRGDVLTIKIMQANYKNAFVLIFFTCFYLRFYLRGFWLKILTILLCY